MSAFTRVIITFAILATSTFAYSAETLDPGRTVYVKGPISSQTLAPVQRKMEELLTSPDRSAVNVIINSPGGEVLSGMSLVNKVLALKERGIDVDCYVLDMAASMAFQLFTQCTNRYALNNSYLLWHGVRTSYFGPITTNIARAMVSDLKRMDATVLGQLYSSLSIKPVDVRKHFRHETLWTGAQLSEVDFQFVTVASAYLKVTEVMGKEKMVTSEPPAIFFFGSTEDTTVFHSIWRPYEHLLIPSLKE